MAKADCYTRINFSDDDFFAEIFTSRPRMIHKMRKLHDLFPSECVKIEEIKDSFSVVQHWRVPYFWFNCRKRPEPINKPTNQKRTPPES